MLKNRELLEIIEKTTFKYPRNIVHLFTGGSHQHGARLPGTGDLDIAGVYVEPPSIALGLPNEKGFVASTGNNASRNVPGDEDYCLKTLHEFARLAAKGNPTILGYLFAPDAICDPEFADTVWATHIKPNAHLFASVLADAAFLGYGKSQHARMKGLAGRGRHGQRPELETKFGFDTKAAMHMIRMMHEGLEYVTTGIITYPRPEVSKLLEIRAGEWTEGQVEREYFQLEAALILAKDTSPLPQRADIDTINKMLADAYITAWKQFGEI